MKQTKITKKVREAILSKTKNHDFGKDGFCKCKMHRTDWRPNDLCRLKM